MGSANDQKSEAKAEFLISKSSCDFLLMGKGVLLSQMLFFNLRWIMGMFFMHTHTPDQCLHVVKMPLLKKKKGKRCSHYIATNVRRETLNRTLK